MPSPQRTAAALPLDQQSVLPAVRGLPWWGAVLLATGLTVLGAVIDGMRLHDLGSIYKFLYLLGCVAAALAVRRRALFTAAAQPPLIGFVVSMLALYQLNSEQASSSTRSLIFKVLLPIADNFPWMATTFVITLLLVLARWYLTRKAPVRAPDSERAPDPVRAQDSDRAQDSERNARPKRPRREADGRPTRSRTTKPDSTAAPSSTAKPPSGERTRGPRVKRGGAKPVGPDENAPTSRAQARGVAGTAAVPPPAAPRPKRATAGQVMRAEAGPQLGEDPRPSAATDLAPYESATRNARRSYPVSDAAAGRRPTRSRG